MGRRLDMVNPQILANYQPNLANHPNAMAPLDAGKNTSFPMLNQNFNL